MNVISELCRSETAAPRFATGCAGSNGGPIQVLCVCEPLAGGVPVYVEQLVHKLEGEEMHFTVACPRRSILRQRLADSLVTFADVEMNRGLNPITETRALFQLRSLIAKGRFDVVHLHSSKAGLLGRMITALWKRPTIFTPHCFSFESVPALSLTYRAYLAAERRLGAFTDVLVCVSSHERKLALRCGIAPPERVSMTPCFVDTARWSLDAYSPELKQRLGIPEKNRVVGTLSRFHPQKAPLDFARCAEMVLRQRSDVTFLFIGEDGPLRLEFEGYVKSKGLVGNVLLQEWTDDQELLTGYMALMDVFMLNSLWEGCPLSVIEAMAMERPVVATDIPALCEMVGEPGAGLLSIPGQPELAAENILRVLDSPRLASRLGANGRRQALTKYALDRIAERHRELYLELAGRTSGAPLCPLGA
jgi:glycosyltransferase involved in cell wall biosynthesis